MFRNWDNQNEFQIDNKNCFFNRKSEFIPEWNLFIFSVLEYDWLSSYVPISENGQHKSIRMQPKLLIQTNRSL